MTNLPLFPLNTVLFPGIPLSLHIFEERYKQMVSACLETQQPFGVVLIREGVEALGPLAEPHPIGCSAQIVQVERLDQGRMHIAAVGLERFRILNLNHDRPYLVGEIEQYPLAEEDPLAVERAGERLRPFVTRYLQILAEAGNLRLEPEDLPADTLSLSYLAAYVLQIPLIQKQKLLASKQASQLLTNLRWLYRQEIALLSAIMADERYADEAAFTLN